MQTQTKLTEHNCRHCGRRIIQENGYWIDPEATGDDSIWREVCDSHDTFDAVHEPKLMGKFYECGICDCIHPWDWDDDCRDDANRLNLDDIADNAELLSWEDRQTADDDSQTNEKALQG